MRTTLAIDDDVLIAAKAIARQQHKSIGEVVSDLARRALHRPQAPAVRNGIPLLPVRDTQAVVTLDIVNTLRDELP
ncbi:CopG family transcriptional regulator [Oleomonas cavernae]|uniref:CopG family transcriptional regulator n=1 Tax=Oleomonas cavernae TaxID=2320859 RepID=A0A418WD58_9PROT|nr:CopG family transcriptional regulator [Oleomonas cavernae]RJF87953.1 CopG family transcriptional regulator [Oleomonas cavernae]